MENKKTWVISLFNNCDKIVDIALNNSITKNRLFSFNKTTNLFHFKSLNWIQEFDFNIKAKMIKIKDPKTFEILANKIIEAIENAHKLVPSIKTNQIENQDYSVNHKGKLNAIITSIMNRLCYEEKINIIDLVSEIVVRIARAHIWNNGNKRTAIVSASFIFYLFGFYIRFLSKKSEILKNYIGYWSEIMIKIVAPNVPGKEETKISDDEAIDILRKEFKENICIDYNNIVGGQNE